jgi:hypothetical protein
MVKGTKLSWIFGMVLIFANSTKSSSQTLADFFKNSATQLTYLGIDYTQNRLINNPGGNVNDIRDRLYSKMNDVVLNEMNSSKNYDIGGAFGRKNAINVDIEAVAANNEKIDFNNIMSAHKSDFKRLKAADIANCIAALPLENKEGIGLVFIMEGMKKAYNKGYGSVWVTLIDMKEKKVLMAERVEEEAEGFGFRNYWVSVIRKTIIGIEWSRYKDWKKKYSS